MKNNLLIFIDFLKKLYQTRYMIRSMAVRDMRARYVGSLFGFLWAVVNPLSQVAIYGIVFGVFFKSKPDPIYGTDSYLLYLLCGLIPWQFFGETVGASSGVILSNSNLVKKAVGFPSEILPIITVTTGIINHLIGVGLLLLITILFTAKLTLFTPLILLYLFFISIFAVGIGWILSSVNVYIRDVQQIVGVALMGLFFFTPIFYSPSIVPGMALTVLKLNPMYHMVEGYRLALLAGKSLPIGDIAYLAVVSCLTFGVGGIFFRKLKPEFAEVL